LRKEIYLPSILKYLTDLTFKVIYLVNKFLISLILHILCLKLIMKNGGEFWIWIELKVSLSEHSVYGQRSYNYDEQIALQ